MWTENRNGKLRMYERYYANGKYHRASVELERDTPQCRNKAKTKLDKIISDRTAAKSSMMDLNTLFLLYNNDITRVLKDSTKRRNVRECRTLLKILGNVKVSDLNARYVKEKIVKYNPKPSTVNEHIQRFKAVIKWGFVNDYVDNISFLDKITKLKDVPKKEKVKDKFLESEECNLLLESMVEHWRLLAHFMILSGARCGECLALKESDVDMQERVIHITKNKDNVTGSITTPKTSCSIRDIYIQDELYPLCEEILERNNRIGEHDSLFPYCEYFAFNKYLRETSKAVIGRAITPHVLRHTHASLLCENDLKYNLIAERLGHRNSRITEEIYIHITEKKEEKDNQMIKGVRLL